MKKLLFIFVFIPLFILGGCIDYVVPVNVKYRVIVEINTPEGVKTGSAVRVLSARKSYHMGFASEYVASREHGEAVPIDLGERGVVFALMSSWGGLSSAFRNGNSRSIKPDIELKFYKSLKIGDKVQLESGWPKFVMFESANDPKSVRLIKGKKFNVKTQNHDSVDDFEILLGEGVSLKSVSIEITKDDVTWGVVDQYLPKNFQKDVKDKWMHLTHEESSRLHKLTKFKQGEK